MHAPREQPQHANGIAGVDRLAEDRLINHDNRVRSQYQVFGPATPDCQRLLAR
jgi:hypothetical protein